MTDELSSRHCNTLRVERKHHMLTRLVFNRWAMKTIGERIRQAREFRGLSGEGLAEKVGYKTQSGIGNLENRATGRGGFRLPKIAEVLDVPVDWLLNGPDVEDLRTVVEAAHQAQESRRAYVITPRQRAAAIIERLNDTGVQKAVEYLELLETKFSRSSSNGADHPVSAPPKSANG